MASPSNNQNTSPNPTSPLASFSCKSSITNTNSAGSIAATTRTTTKNNRKLSSNSDVFSSVVSSRVTVDKYNFNDKGYKSILKARSQFEQCSTGRQRSGASSEGESGLYESQQGFGVDKLSYFEQNFSNL